MLGYLFLIFIFMPITELALLIKIGQHLGVTSTILLVIFTGITGAALAKVQGVKVLWEIRDHLSQGIVPEDQLIEGILVLIGAVLLLTPGLITDALGFSFLLPLTRRYFVGQIKKRFENYLQYGTFKIFIR